MKPAKILTTTTLMIMATLMIVPVFNLAAAQDTPPPPSSVCVTTAGSSCPTVPSTPVQITGAVGSLITIWVAYHGNKLAGFTKSINGFDIIAIADHNFLSAVSADISSSVLGPASETPGVIIRECVAGVDMVGNGCAIQDTIDATHVAVGAPALSDKHIVGDLFAITYTVVAVPSTPIPIAFQIGCPLSSVSGTSQCVLVTNGSGSPVGLVSVGATFI